ncbi:phosphate acyltransferase PlsX [Fervidobacterium thailandense]|uniref:Phosphate acyltransferase n=1 Tax=Fervidobacterium thailandense TaxID=1008305 RepID=A0A1E3G364_9BACT|nr:phosphate acyltransferase PlsX [Fervidobacterium thailandense]ODN30677.1 phosphate acyltransferase [Fervidobacterium thailandense]
MIRIALDLMGGDKAPEEIKTGAFMYAEFLKKSKINNVKIHIVGLPEHVKDFESHPLREFFVIVPTRDFLPMDIKPTEALRRKESSMYVCSQMLKEKQVDAIVSAGNTGALLACATLVVGRIKGIERPALAVPVPSLKGFTVLIDAGANAEVKPEWLVQFAEMGIEYAKLLGIPDPKVGLLNVGTEENKGTEREKQAYALLKERYGARFHGNVEGSDINLGTVDVVVTDGFSGNIAMKTMEGVAKLISTIIKQEAKKSVDGILGALLFARTLKRLKKKLDPRSYGGTFFLGVDGLVIKAHGNSDRVAIKNALEVARRGVENQLVEKLRRSLGREVND